MRIFNALKADLRFQMKQGFFTVYIYVTLAYMIILHYLPNHIVQAITPLIVFSDPSLVGFFFIGAIVMLEKTQGVLQYLIITPLRSKEYLASKVISLAILATVAGSAISGFAYKGQVQWFLLVPALVLVSAFFTLYGFIAAAGCRTMNQYFMRMIPYLLIIIIPCFSILLPNYQFLFDIIPSVSAFKLVYGAFHTTYPAETLCCLIYLTIADVWMFFKVDQIFTQKIVYGEGKS